MSKKLAALLRTTSMGLPDMAQAVRKGGRKGDSILAHINPREAALLKAHGGSGEINPETGLPEFDDGIDTSADNIDVGGGFNPATGAGDVATAQAAAAAPPVATENIPSTYSTAPAAAGAPTAFATPETFAPQSLPSAAPSVAAPAAALPSAPQLSSSAETPTAAAAPAKSFTDQLSDKTSALAKALGTDGMGLAKLGLGGLGAIQGMQASKQAQKQAGVGAAQMTAMGQPFVDQGNQLVQLGQAGGLTAPQQQAIQAMRAQTQQALANSGQAGGGTAAQQAEANVQRAAQVFAQNNIDEGMKMINIGNTYVQNAIKLGYQQSTDAQAASSNFYKNLMGSIPTSAAAPGQAKVEGTNK